MKHRKLSYLSCLLILLCSIVLTSCFDDASTLATREIPKVTVDQGQQKLVVFQFSKLTVKPELNIQGDPRGLTYEWKHNLVAGDTSYKVISHDKYLKGYKVNLIPNIEHEHYQLVYTVTEKGTGLETIVSWPLVVKSVVGEGLVVATTPDGSHTDLSIIMSPRVTANYSKVSVKRKIYSKVNGKLIDGLIKDMQYVVFGKKPTLLAITDHSIIKIHTLSYEKVGMNDSLFYRGAQPNVYKPQFIGRANGKVIFANNHTMYSIFVNIGQFGIPIHSKYPVPNVVAYIHKNLAVSSLSFYDEKDDRFLYVHSARKIKTVPTPPDSVHPPFNPESLPGKQNVAAGYSRANNAFMHFLRDESTGDIDIYTLEHGYNSFPDIPPTPKKIFELNGAPDLSNAKYFVVLPNQEVLYYATSRKIYAVLYSTPTPKYQLRYTLPPGEHITTLNLYQQIGYPWSGGPYIDTNNKQLVMSTYDGSEGRVYLMPIVHRGVGDIDKANIKVFGGFNKVIAINAQK